VLVQQLNNVTSNKDLYAHRLDLSELVCSPYHI